MNRSITLFIFLALFSTTIISANQQIGKKETISNKSPVQKFKRVETKNMIQKPHTGLSKQQYLNKITFDGDTLAWTDFDYAGNNVMAKRLALTENGVHAVHESMTGEYSFISSGSISKVEFNGSAPEVLNGMNNEAIIVSNIYSQGPGAKLGLLIDSCQGCLNFSTTVIADGFSLTSITGSGNKIYLGTNKRLLVSTDYGATFTQSAAFPEPIIGSEILNSEISLIQSPTDPNTVAFAFTEEKNDISIFNGAISWSKSTDAGATWETNVIYNEENSIGASDHYLVNNFSQFNNAFSAEGKFHLVFNGYGVKTTNPSSDSVDYSIFPIVYWNDEDQAFIELSSESINRNRDLSNSLSDNRPGNGIGNAYPTIALHDDGIIAVIWQQPEIVNNELTLLTNSDDESIYATDIYCAISGDNGLNWSAPFMVAGVSGESDVYPSLAPDIEKTPEGKYIIHFSYMWDSEIGTSLFDGGGAISSCAWIYKSFDISDNLTPLLDIKSEKINSVKSYVLQQNYPNPFNPATTIKYTLAENNFVSLKIYNSIGEIVTTLLESNQSAGVHSIKFNAQNLSSGIYFYELKAGNFKQMKKMLLLK